MISPTCWGCVSWHDVFCEWQTNEKESSYKILPIKKDKRHHIPPLHSRDLKVVELGNQSIHGMAKHDERTRLMLVIEQVDDGGAGTRREYHIGARTNVGRSYLVVARRSIDHDALAHALV